MSIFSIIKNISIRSNPYVRRPDGTTITPQQAISEKDEDAIAQFVSYGVIREVTLSRREKQYEVVK